MTRFQLALEQFLGTSTVIATTTKPADPFGGIAWLADRGYEPHRFEKRLMSDFRELSRVGTLARYRRAYQLAQQARRVSSLSSVASGIQRRVDELQVQIDWLRENIFRGLEVPF